MNYTKINNVLGWACAIIATVTYMLTAERSTSWWDCGEFIASAYKMQIVHQPGAPLFLMIQNIFSNLALGDVTRIAFWMNVGSGVCSGITILFLFWTITALARKVVTKTVEGDYSSADLIKIFGSGLVGALAYAFSDTFWFSAVESEVYAMSSLCTAVVFWGILKWENHADEPGSDRWLIFIAYVMGLSIGVHLLNLLVIPAIALVIYFKRAKTVTSKGAIQSFLLGVVVLAVILWGVIQYSVKFAAYFDLFFVNSLGMGFGTGFSFFVILLVGLLAYGIWYSIKKVKPILNIVLIGASFIIFGYSSFAMIMIRAKANPTLNNSDPENAFTFLSYLGREQYASEPLFKGPNFDSKITGVEPTYSYRKDQDKYTKIQTGSTYQYDKEVLFPRVYSNRDGHPGYYADFLKLGEGQSPTFGDNLKFFFSYQIGHMYGRYFLWNFAGRQNDQQGHGTFTEGNWISGIKPIDQMLVGGQNAIPDSLKTDPSNNKYYFLPLIIGLIGAFWHFGKRQKDAGVVGLLFFFTGLAIVLYLNQSPLQPRERDYAYAGSFYAFAIWIGLGVFAIADFLGKKMNPKTAAGLTTVACLLAAPVLLAKENWDDHDRSHKLTARDLAKDYLESCAPNAILFTYGDNDTYPLWYAQEVEGIRTDVRVVNLSLLSADWYMEQMQYKANNADALPINIDKEKFKKGVRDVMYYQDVQVPGHVDLNLVLQIMLSDDPKNKAQLNTGEFENFLPTKNLSLAVDRNAVIQNKVVPKEWESSITDTLTWTYNKGYVTRAELSILSILAHNNWKRPIYFATTVPNDNYLGLDKYLVQEGFALRLMPINVAKENEGSVINTDAAYTDITKKYAWGNFATSPYLDPESYRMLSLITNTITGSTATQLLEQGKAKEAKEVAVLTYEKMPKRVFLMRDALSYALVINVLYSVGENQKANDIVSRNLLFLKQNMAYYNDIAQTKAELEYANIQTALRTLGAYKSILSQTKETKLLQEVTQLENGYKKQFGLE
ncbi:DUF2723 domain-containing protein [Sphingobacterium sp. SRCM116780]|uniref:glycosyltransferase family 117 protein n=1 Tax=Sphingobacterium sp. SRCM116780 TaxID=2907623 RepID=UPI001F239914|nr:DUF2723 domain-containing protein [Sphingobacterium sp. SRCM116780]UIR56329.1 DUF2723 domain-containing protein [Sphingobacterium sp. SRCM116780]